MAAKKYEITQLQNDSTLLGLHPATDADIVNVEQGQDKYKGQANNVQDALEELYDLAEQGGVTGVKGAAEQSYRTGNVTLTPENLGAQEAFQDGSAVIASETNGVVTIKAGIAQNGGSVGNSSDTDIVLGQAAKKGVATSVGSASTNDDLATAKAVYDAIDALPEPMIFKGSLGTGGTITDLPTASSANEGFVYKVITDGTYAGQAAKIGDLFISNGSAWVYIPSADEPSGTVTSVNVESAIGSHVVVTGGPITTSGTLTITLENGYSIPTTSKQNDWDGKYDLPATGMPKSDLAQGVQDSLDLADSALQEHQTITLSGDASGTSNEGTLVVTLAASGVAAGTYSAVSVNTKGLVTGGAQLIEIGSTGQTTPSASLAVGGLFFEEV